MKISFLTVYPDEDNIARYLYELPENVDTPSRASHGTGGEEEGSKSPCLDYSTITDKSGAYIQDGKKQCHSCGTETWTFCSYCGMNGCFKCCLKSPDALCPHDNHRGEHVVHETLDPIVYLLNNNKLFVPQVKSSLIPKNSSDADFIGSAIWVMEYEAKLLTADSETRDKSHLIYEGRR